MDFSSDLYWFIITGLAGITLYIFSKKVAFRIFDSQTIVKRAVLLGKKPSTDIIANFETVQENNYIKLTEIFKMIKLLCWGGYLTALLIFALFFGITYQKPTVELDTYEYQQKAVNYKAHTKETIDAINEEILTKAENKIEKEVKKAQEESKTEYDEFIKNSLK